MTTRTATASAACSAASFFARMTVREELSWGRASRPGTYATDVSAAARRVPVRTVLQRARSRSGLLSTQFRALEQFENSHTDEHCSNKTPCLRKASAECNQSRPQAKSRKTPAHTEHRASKNKSQSSSPRRRRSPPPHQPLSCHPRHCQSPPP